MNHATLLFTDIKANDEQLATIETLVTTEQLPALVKQAQRNAGALSQAALLVPRFERMVATGEQVAEKDVATFRQALAADLVERCRASLVHAGACGRCGKPVTFYAINAWLQHIGDKPAACHDCLHAEWRKEERDRRLAEFFSNNRLAQHYVGNAGAPPNPEAYQAVQDWRHRNESGKVASCGLVLVGGSFTGKTTAVYHLAHRLVMRPLDDFTSVVMCVTASELNRIPDMARDGTLDAFTTELRDVGVLILDDLDKVNVTPRIASELWALFETRLREYHAPTFITMNVRSRRAFIKLFRPRTDAEDTRQFGESIYNRIRESMQFVDFDKESP